MINFTSEQINKAFDDLSPEKSDAMFSIDIDSKIKELATKYTLNEEQSKNIDYYITLSIIGLLREDQLSETITTELKINPEISAQIASDLKSFIFDVIENREKDSKERASVLSQENFEIIDPRFENMPDSVKEAISLSDWKEVLYKISSDNKLNIEQMEILEDLTVKTMKNEINPDKYKEEVSSKILTDKDKIDNIVKEVSVKIFQEIRNLMRESEKDESLIARNSDPLKEDTINLSLDKEDEVPVPPYADKNEVSPKKEEISFEIKAKPLFNNAQNIINNEIQNIENNPPEKISLDTPSPSGFSVPKVDIAKQTVPSTPISSPAKPHDPYREVI